MKSSRVKVSIKSILGGMQRFKYNAAADEYYFGMGIDPEVSGSSDLWPYGAICPMGMSHPSGITDYVKAAPVWMSGASESAGVWVTCADGSLYSFAYNFTSGEVGIGNPGGTGNGMVVYNDYVYQATGTDIYRHGRISQTGPAFAQYWTTTLAMSAMTSTTYPSTRGVSYPNHVLHKHNDGYVYVADYDGERGRIHRFITDADGTGGTADWSVLSLPPKMMPMHLASYGTDLAVVCTPDAKWASGAIPRTADATVYLWDTTQGNSFYRAIPVGEQMATAAAVLDGDLFVFAGALDAGMRLLQYLGGSSMREVAVFRQGSPPFAGAVDVMGDAVVWGHSFTDPTACAGVMASGMRRGGGRNKVHGIARVKDVTSTLPVVSAVKMLSRDLWPALGWRTDTPAQYGLGVASTSNMNGVWYSQPIVVGKKFILRRLTMMLSNSVTINTAIAPVVYTDNMSRSFQGGEAGLEDVNITNFPGGAKLIDFRDLSCHGETDCVLALTMTGTVQDAVLMPIELEFEVYD